MNREGETKTLNAQEKDKTLTQKRATTMIDPPKA